MKKLFTILLFITSMSNLYPVEIAVKSFRKLETDLDARVTEPVKDQNGDLCAIIKVVTTEVGFSFDCGQIGVVKTVNKPSEIWVYVPFGAKHITISHPQLGMLRDYLFRIPIEKATSYELKLITGKVVTTVEEEISSQWLLINPQPKEAMIYLNDQFVKNGLYQSKVKPGTYTYRVEMPLYHPEAGKIEITDSKKELNVNLRPAFGYIAVNSDPETGAKVIIDGKPQTKTTPFKSDAIASGEHTVQIVKELYKLSMQKATVMDGQTTTVSFVMQPNFGEVTIIAPADATLYINNQKKGTGAWTGRLNEGVYSFEVRKDRFRPARQDIEVIAGKRDTLELKPSPIYGSLDVMTNPSGANIIIDGKDCGTTPNTIKNLPIGDCTVQLNKAGYASISTTVIISEDKSTELIETLQEGAGVVSSQSTTSYGSLEVATNPSGVSILIEGKNYGESPTTINNLPIGMYNVQLNKPGFTSIDKRVNIVNGETVKLSETLYNGRNVTVKSNAVDANLFVDDILISKTPYTGNLSFGSHILRAEQGGQKVEKAVNISPAGDENSYNLDFMTKTISITSNPSDVDVTIDGKYLGKTPIKAELTVGMHPLQLKNADKSNSQDIEISNETSSVLYFELTDCYSKKTITSEPTGATVFINGEEKGITPFSYTMMHKEDIVEIKEKGYKPYKETLLCEGKDVTASLTMSDKKRTRFLMGFGTSFPLINKPDNSVYSSSSTSSTSPLQDSLMYEFRIGFVKTTGIYFKLTTNMSKSSNVDYTINTLPSDNYYNSVESKPVFYTNRFGVVGGLMLNLKPIMLYAGAGYGYYNHYIQADMYKYSDGTLVKTINLGDKNSYAGLETDAGMIIYAGFIGVSVGVSSIEFKHYELTAGITLVF